MASILTARSVDTVKPDPSRRLEIPDGIVPGLYLVVQPSGAKSWALRYRIGGTPAKHTLGTTAVLSLAAARQNAKDALEGLGVGKDPRAARRAPLPAPVALPGTVGEIADAYATRYLDKHVRRADAAKGEIENYIRPHLGALGLGEITRAHVRQMLAEIEAKHPVAANRVLARTRAMFRWALDNDLATTDPTLGIKRPTKERPVERTFSDDELAKVWRACDTLKYPAREYMRLLILSGQRRDDVRCMTWGEIDLARGDWTIPASRYKGDRPHLVPLTRRMVEILESLPFRDRGGSVFSPKGGTVAYGNLVKPKRAIDKASGVSDWTLHDIRRSFRTGLSRLGIRGEVSERCIGHSVGGRLGQTYDTHEYRAEKLAAFEAWDAHVRAVVEGADKPNVVKLRGRARAARAAS